MIEELDCVVLTEDVADYDLKTGDVGTVVMVHGEGGGFEVEFIALNGETIAVVMCWLRKSDLRSVAKSPMLGK